MRLRPLAYGVGLLSLAGCGEPAVSQRAPAPPTPARDMPLGLAADELRRRLHELGLGRVADQLEQLVEPCVRLQRREGPPPAGPTSRLGGTPELPPTTAWPQWEGRELAFVAQIRLEELPPNVAIGLPRAGLLSFFYVQDQSTWGFKQSDRGSFRVLFTPDASLCTRRESPEAIARDHRFAESCVIATATPSLPSPEHDACAVMDLTEAEQEALFELAYPATGPVHQMGGHPHPVQNDTMQTECAMLADGVDCGDGKAWSSPKAPTWQREGRHWRLLLQLDSDDRPGWMWGDAGMLYFWIRDEDLARAEFGNVWMILQCH